MEQRKHTAAARITAHGIKHSIKLYPASAWGPGADADLYRVQVNGKWHNRDGEKEFLPLSGIAVMLAQTLTGYKPGAKPPRPQGLDSPRQVWVTYEDLYPELASEIAAAMDADPSLPPALIPSDQPLYKQGWTLAPPHLGPHGTWLVWVSFGGNKHQVAADKLITRR